MALLGAGRPTSVQEAVLLTMPLASGILLCGSLHCGQLPEQNSPEGYDLIKSAAGKVPLEPGRANLKSATPSKPTDHYSSKGHLYNCRSRPKPLGTSYFRARGHIFPSAVAASNSPRHFLSPGPHFYPVAEQARSLLHHPRMLRFRSRQARR